MFSESMLETSWAYRTRRSWMTLTSFGLQAVVIGLLLMIPLLQTVGLPGGRVLQPPVSFAAPPSSRPIEHQHATTLVQSNLADNGLIAPSSIPRHVQMIEEAVAPPQVSYNSDPGVPGAIGDGSRNGVWRSITDSLNHAIPPFAPPPSIKRTFRTSTILEGSLIRRVQPIYPPLARMAGIQGPVVVAATINKAGTMDHVQAISGHPMLVRAALDAVSQWRYKPYILNGEAIEVETQITVKFVLGEK